MAYEVFSRVYDQVMDDTLYERWLKVAEHFFLPETMHVLELACGSGALACLFARAGYQVTGADLSADMLSLAYDRALDQELSIDWIEADMRELSDIGTYQAITCFSDSLCYMSNEQALEQVFQAVYQALEPGGVFLFDVHSVYQIDQLFPDYRFHYQEEDVAFLWESYAGEEEHSIDHCLTFFVAEDDLFRRYDEVHHERTYPIATYQRLLLASGFQTVDVFADFEPNQPLKEDNQRWFFAAVKEK